ncbi:unnamed protein product [Owenia fusiformis]|uniref:Uncharacterized protein n=1 Tax=Owenia fusiformis TaxID=6347 RepID=A0A8J1XVZ1_OWEFU|nr:unnamed protein product [Owenia fusiformis]
MRIFHFQRFLSIIYGILKYMAFGIAIYSLYYSTNPNQITTEPVDRVRRVTKRIDSEHQSNRQHFKSGFEHDASRGESYAIETIQNNKTSVQDNLARKTLEVVIVTAASARYFYALKNFVGSVHYWERKRRIAVFNIGLTQAQVEQIKYWCNVDIHWEWGIPRSKRMASKDPWEFNWKPFVLTEAIDTYSAILYSDAGSDVRAPLDSIDNILLNDKYFFVNGQDLDMTSLGHEETFRYFGKNKSQSIFKNKPSYAGGLQGYVKSYKIDNLIIKPLLECARSTRCMSPKGSSSINHRYDQTALSIILYSSGLQITAHTEFITTSKQDLNPDPLRKSEYTIYTGRKTSNDFIGKLCFKQPKMVPFTMKKNHKTNHQLSNHYTSTQVLMNKHNSNEIDIQGDSERIQTTNAPKGKWINHSVFLRAKQIAAMSVRKP